MSGLSWMALASLSFAFMNVFARLAHPYVAWSQVAAARCLVSACVALGMARLRGVGFRVQDQRRAWARSIFGTVSLVSTFYVLGSPEIRVADFATLSATAPIFIALLAPFFLSERSEWRVWLATPIAFAGVFVLLRPSLDLAGHLALIALLGALSSAFAMMYLRRLGPNEPPEAVVVHFSTVAAATMVLVSIARWETPAPRGIPLMFAAGLAGGVGQLSLTRAYAAERAARVGVFGYIGVLLNQLLAVLILGEDVGPHQLLGSLLVIASGLVLASGAFFAAR